MTRLEQYLPCHHFKSQCTVKNYPLPPGSFLLSQHLKVMPFLCNVRALRWEVWLNVKWVHRGPFVKSTQWILKGKRTIAAFLLPSAVFMKKVTPIREQTWIESLNDEMIALLWVCFGLDRVRLGNSNLKFTVVINLLVWFIVRLNWD